MILVYQNNPMDASFHLQISLEFFDKKLGDKIWSQKDKEWKVSPLMLSGLSKVCLVKVWHDIYINLVEFFSN